MKVRIECRNWLVELYFRNIDDGIQIGIPKGVEELKRYREDPRGWINVNHFYPSVDDLEDAVELYKLVNNEEFVKEVDRAIGEILRKFIECKEVEEK